MRKKTTDTIFESIKRKFIDRFLRAGDEFLKQMPRETGIFNVFPLQLNLVDENLAKMTL